MKRSENVNKIPQLNPWEVSREIAVHEAGHAAAIYFGNQQKGLPPVFFRIYINQPASNLHLPGIPGENHHQHAAKVEGGRLIHTLPSSLEEVTKHMLISHKHAYIRAFEADIINLLIGPLAEAKYVSARDDEPINHRLVDLNALHFYGGFSDLETVSDYLHCFLSNEELRQKKIAELFLAAFKFVNEHSHWQAINTLADFILEADKNLIEYDEIIEVLEQGSRLARLHRQRHPAASASVVSRKPSAARMN